MRVCMVNLGEMLTMSTTMIVMMITPISIWGFGLAPRSMKNPNMAVALDFVLKSLMAAEPWFGPAVIRAVTMTEQNEREMAARERCGCRTASC